MSDDPIASMRLDQFCGLVEQVRYGKKLRTALYLMPTSSRSIAERACRYDTRAEVAATGQAPVGIC